MGRAAPGVGRSRPRRSRARRRAAGRARASRRRCRRGPERCRRPRASRPAGRRRSPWRSRSGRARSGRVLRTRRAAVSSSSASWPRARRGAFIAARMRSGVAASGPKPQARHRVAHADVEGAARGAPDLEPEAQDLHQPRRHRHPASGRRRVQAHQVAVGLPGGHLRVHLVHRRLQRRAGQGSQGRTRARRRTAPTSACPWSGRSAHGGRAQ